MALSEELEKQGVIGNLVSFWSNDFLGLFQGIKETESVRKPCFFDSLGIPWACERN